MNRFAVIIFFGVLSAAGIGLSSAVGDSKPMMQLYAVIIALMSIVVVAVNATKSWKSLLTCYTMVMLAPIWFLYLEAMLIGGDCWLLPAEKVIQTLSYSPFFLFVFNLAYCFKYPKFIVKFHDRNFLRVVNPILLPSLGVALTIITFVLVLARYNFDWEHTKSVYLAGRAGGAGLIRRGGIGGWEVFLQPLDFMCSSVPTIAALSWVRFQKERSTPMIMKVVISACAAFLIFVMFLGGSRGFLAVYLAGPAAIWILFGMKSVGKISFLVISLVMFSLLIGVWEFQKRKRNDLLKGISNVSEFVNETSFDPTETHRDNNLYLFTLKQMYMPDPYPFAGYDEFLGLLLSPVPRVIWTNKPKGIQADSRSFSRPTGPSAMGPIRLGTASLSQTIVGDGFKMHHYFGIALYALIFGMIASSWDRLAATRFLDTKLYFILNASYLFWLLWGFRASFAFFTGVYPVWGAYLLCYLAGKFGKKLRKAPGLFQAVKTTQPSQPEPAPAFVNTLRS